MERLPATTPTAELDQLRDLANRTAEYLEASRSESTRNAYDGDWQHFVRWGSKRGLPVEVPTNPQTVALYMSDLASDRKASTIARRLSSIKYQHHRLGEPSPTDHPQVRELLGGIRRVRQDDKRQAAPLYLDDLTAAVTTLVDDPKSTRDRALLLVGWWGAMRRSELVALDGPDVEDHPQGIAATLRMSKTDQEGQGRQVPLHYRDDETVCPVRALRSWTTLVAGGPRKAKRLEGPLFRRVDRWGNVSDVRLSGQAVAAVVGEAAARIGLDPTRYTGHALRAGFVSECDRRGIPSSAVRLVTGHQSDAMLATYTRPRSLFDQSAGAFFNGD